MKSFHNIRCEVCNKFITVEDVLDDGLCEECANRLAWMATRRIFPWRMAVYALVIANLILIFWR